MKTAIKILLWTIALMGISAAILYGFWLILIFMLFEQNLYMCLAIAGELLLFSLYWWLIRIASC